MEETNVVVSGVPFQFTVAPLTKLVPFTVKVNCGDPAKHELGLIEVIVGFAASTLLAAANTTSNGRNRFIGKFE